jgi:hypothetical protein
MREEHGSARGNVVFARHGSRSITDDTDDKTTASMAI